MKRNFLKIAKAYAALTDEEARKNWETYGNPDGPGAMSFWHSSALLDC